MLPNMPPTPHLLFSEIRYEYTTQGEAPTGFCSGALDSSTGKCRSGQLVDLARKSQLLTNPVFLSTMSGSGMKECYTVDATYIAALATYNEAISAGNTFGVIAPVGNPATWHSSYNYSIKGARNVDGFPYLSCMPQRDVSGPKNVTVIIGSQMDRYDCEENSTGHFIGARSCIYSV